MIAYINDSRIIKSVSSLISESLSTTKEEEGSAKASIHAVCSFFSMFWLQKQGAPETSTQRLGSGSTRYRNNHACYVTLVIQRDGLPSDLLCNSMAQQSKSFQSYVRLGFAVQRALAFVVLLNKLL
ncbi:hypothetical protein KP509_21G054100 [Ceratopteris richardii]|uniref:Uncharacterized protein n=1 Tax=Ceratopteris richardii TaxID=49495 RepID=A0A8T2SBX4_CERRI|nr:hypothetical protein KP509_21G054100 [Ceratopteris richardii]